MIVCQVDARLIERRTSLGDLCLRREEEACAGSRIAPCRIEVRVGDQLVSARASARRNSASDRPA